MQNRPTIRFLGVDPGTRILGVGWIEVDSLDYSRVVSRGCLAIEAQAKLPVASRLASILSSLEEVFTERAPTHVVIEKVFLGKNVQSALTLGYARGLVLALSARFGAEVLEEAATTAKKSVTGNGAAAKSEVQLMLGRLLNVQAELAAWPIDASDALALAYQGWRNYVVKKTVERAREI